LGVVEQPPWPKGGGSGHSQREIGGGLATHIGLGEDLATRKEKMGVDKTTPKKPWGWFDHLHLV